jgi:hypothetical protein
VFKALTAEPSFKISILARKSSKTTFPKNFTVHTIDDDCPTDQLIKAFRGQDALVSTLPGRPVEVHFRMIDAAIEAGVKRFIPTEYGNNTCAAASEFVELYGEKAKVIAHLKSRESTGLTWTAIHTGQFFDWGLEAEWLAYDLKGKKVTMFDSGNTAWSTTTIDTAAATVVKVLLKPEATVNRPVFVASFTVTQQEVLRALEKASGAKWEVDRITSAEAFKKAHELSNADHSEGLKLLILLLLYSDEADRGANFEKMGVLDNKLLGLPVENMTEVVERLVKAQAS